MECKALSRHVNEQFYHSTIFLPRTEVAHGALDQMQLGTHIGRRQAPQARTLQPSNDQKWLFSFHGWRYRAATVVVVVSVSGASRVEVLACPATTAWRASCRALNVATAR